ncbi:hypothetical protein FACS1894192_07440 [Bacilli bacterium]|nr:hypothetical protein FACS1894192_07440 [Bacilli bacterium]
MKVRVIEDLKPDYNFKKEEIYQVYVVNIKDNETFVLIDWGKTGIPQWFSMEYFEVIDTRIPYNWTIEICTDDNSRNEEFPFWGIQIVRNGVMMGYDKFVKTLRHEAGLLERNKEDLDYFYENIHNQIDTID